MKIDSLARKKNSFNTRDILHVSLVHEKRRKASSLLLYSYWILSFTLIGLLLYSYWILIIVPYHYNPNTT